MAWISLFFLITSVWATPLPRFLTKHASDTLRYISMDGRYAYVKKKPGVLGLVSSFRSVDFLTENNDNDFLIRSSRFKKRLAIESIPMAHTEMSLVKNHRIFVLDYGNTVTREIGIGRNAKLHLGDEWISYYNMIDKSIYLQNLLTQKNLTIKLSKKQNPFFIPDVEMVSQRAVIYTDINEAGYSALVSYDIAEKRSQIIYKSSQSATRLETCEQQDYLAFGEFPFDGVNRGSSIKHIKLSDVTNLSGHTTLYSSSEQDIGNIVCHPNDIFFIKTLSYDKEYNLKISEAVKLEIKSKTLKTKSALKNVGQIIEMDGRVLIPFRGTYLVLEGKDNIGEDILKTAPTKEELQIDI